MSVRSAQHFYLVGIKGVAQTALAQCLLDMGKHVRGTDVAEDFVTAPILSERNIAIDIGFDHTLPDETECVIYTSAHGSQNNPLVQQALEKKIPAYSHAEALAELFNVQEGIAVCGVGGKSTTSALLSWIFSRTTHDASFAVGVGNIIGLNKTGYWSSESTYFVAEADEYVTDPSAVARGEEITPRFSFLKPSTIICTNLQYDHPDVYKDFAHTQEVFFRFFTQLKPHGTLIYNADDTVLSQLAMKLQSERPDLTLLSFGQNESSALRITQVTYEAGKTQAEAAWHDQNITFQLALPGLYNVKNAAAGFIAAVQAGIELKAVTAELKTFSSTLRRNQYLGKLAGAPCFDDYAHHPSEITQVIQGLKAWYPDKKLLVAFQPHTFSRTAALLTDFAQALSPADQILLLKIFASARENDTHTVTNQNLIQALQQINPAVKVSHVETIAALADELKTHVTANTVILTLGAGDIYHVYDHLNLSHD